MSPGGNYQCKLVNGLAGDPAVYVFSPMSGDAHLFDLGSLNQMTHKDLLRVKCVLVSHTHVDHFIGFDRWLRVNVPHHRELTVVGPKGIADNVYGKLCGYSWNLIEPKQISFKVWEVIGSSKAACFKVDSENMFKPQPMQTTPKQSARKHPLAVTELSDQAQILAIDLDHGIPSIAYAIKTPLYYEVDTKQLQSYGLSPGPWIGELQRRAKARDFDENLIVGEKTFDTRELAENILIERDIKPLGYVTDIVFSLDNLERAQSLLSGVTTLYCESHFAAEHAKRARDKKHLTSKQAALIAAYVNAEHLVPFHISNIYHGSEREVVNEALSYFNKFRLLSQDGLKEVIHQQLS